MLREAGGRRFAGCGHIRLPSFNGMTSLDTDIMDDDHNTNTQVRWTREPPAGVANLSMRGERRCAAQGGAIWCAAAAIIFPSLLDGFDGAFDAAVAPAQLELWLPLGVARDSSARPELCCERVRDRVCMPHAACESRLRARASDGRRPRVCLRVVFMICGWPPP